MSFLQAVLLGLVEGITEYLPISSTFHLIWTSRLLNLPQTEFQKAFEVIIQSGAILAVTAIYTKEVLSNISIIKKLIISFIPTALVGVMFYKTIKLVFFENLYLQLFVFIFVGIVFILFERKHTELKLTISKLTTKQAILIGLGQALAIIPGVSRAGAVILTMMAIGVKRSEAAKYSFLLAVPTLLSAGILDIYKSKDVLFTQTSNLLILLIGIIISFFGAMFIVKWFIKYLQKNSLAAFGWYRIVLGIILLLTLL